MKETTRIARGATAVFTSNVYSNFVMFIFYIVITHKLALDSLGVLYSMNIISGFISTFLLLQLPGGFSRFVVGYYQTNRFDEARYLFRRGLMVATIITVAAGPSLILFAPIIMKLLLGHTEYLTLYYLVVADFLLNTYNGFLGVAVSARRIFGFGSLVGAISTTAKVGLAVALITLGYGIISVFYGWIASDLVSLAANLYFSRTLMSGTTTKVSVRSVVAYSMPFFIANGLVVVLQNVDRLFVLKYLGTISLGVYGTLLIASSIPKILPSSLGGTLFPAMIKFEEQQALTRGVVTKAVRYMAMINLPVLGLVAALGEPLLHVFLGRSFYGSWTSFSILVFGGGAMSLDIPLTQVLLAKKKTKILALQQLVSSSALALFAVILIPRLYLDGAALAYVIARVVGFIVVGVNVYRVGLFSVNVRAYVGSLGVTGALVFTTILTEYFTHFSVYLLPLYVGVGVATGVLSARYIGVLQAGDRQEVVDFFPQQFRALIDTLWRKLDLPVE
jgi:O-antigen/teichoic acid export membrane protein